MQVSNDILQKFAKMIDPKEEKKEPTLEFYGKIKSKQGEYWSVTPSLSSNLVNQEVASENVLCKSQVEVKDGDDVKYKIGGSDAIIIENITNPSGNEVVTKSIEKPVTWTRLSQDEHSTLYNMGKIIYEIPANELAELLTEYSILGIGSVYLKAKRKESEDNYTVIWDNDDAMLSLAPTLSFLGYNLIYDGQYKPSSIKFAWYVNANAYYWDFKICIDLLLINSNKNKNI